MEPEIIMNDNETKILTLTCILDCNKKEKKNKVLNTKPEKQLD